MGYGLVDAHAAVFEAKYGNGVPIPESEICQNTIPVYSQTLENITLMPNPTTGQLRIENGELRVENVEVFDVFGRILSSHHLIPTSSHHQIDISHLPSGLYFVKISTSVGQTIKKVVKQ